LISQATTRTYPWQHLLTLLSSLLRHGGLADIARCNVHHLDVLSAQGLNAQGWKAGRVWKRWSDERRTKQCML
jgi:hypothetical protein